MKTGNKFFEGVEQFKYMGTHINPSCIHEEIKSKQKSGNDCYNLVKNLLSSSSLSKNIKMKIHITIIWPVVLYGCATWSVTLREEHRLRVFENRVLRMTIGSTRDKIIGEWKRLQNAELYNLYSPPNITWVNKS
jgi:hypothetical protein